MSESRSLPPPHRPDEGCVAVPVVWASHRRAKLLPVADVITRKRTEPCDALLGRPPELGRKNQKGPRLRAFREERLKGLEPSTFCMASSRYGVPDLAIYLQIAQF